MSGIKGYRAGYGATFTPSKKATWTEGFNDLLVTTGMSRNALTDHLLEIGLAHVNKNEKPTKKIEVDTLFDNAYFTPLERELLETTTYQQILRKFAKRLTTNSRTAMETTFQQSTSSYFPNVHSVPIGMEHHTVPQPFEIHDDIPYNPSPSPVTVEKGKADKKELQEKPTEGIEKKPIKKNGNSVVRTEIRGRPILEIIDNKDLLGQYRSKKEE